MTFVMYYLVGFLKSMGWPRKLGLPMLRKEVVEVSVIRVAIHTMVDFATVLSAKRPDTAICIIANSFSPDFKKTAAVEFWAWLDPTRIVASHPQLRPAEAIARFSFDGKDWLRDAPSDLLPWDLVVGGEGISLYSQVLFAQALVWGIEHPEEALTAYEAHLKALEEMLPNMISAGLKLDAPYRPPTSDEVCESIEEVIASYQKEVPSFGTVPQDLLALPSVAQRLSGRELRLCPT
jgi:hypothetical protein